MIRTGSRLVALTLLVLASAWGCGESGPPASADVTWPTNRSYPDVSQGNMLLITNSFSDTITVIDADTFEVFPEIHVGLNPVDLEGPHHVIADPQAEYYYTALSNAVTITGSGPHGAHGSGTVDGYALKFRTRDHALVGRVRIDRNPGDVIT